jgi:hypothetical protein
MMKSRRPRLEECSGRLDPLMTGYDPFETIRLQTVPRTSGGTESPESVRQRSNLAELLAYAQCQEQTQRRENLLPA